METVARTRGDEPYGGYFQSVNRGKRSLELDLAEPGDREDFLSLVESADVFADPHVEARRMLHEVEQPGAGESVTIAGNPIKVSETPPAPGERAPLLDEHREELLGETEGA